MNWKDKIKQYKPISLKDHKRGVEIAEQCGYELGKIAIRDLYAERVTELENEVNKLEKILASRDLTIGIMVGVSLIVMVIGLAWGT